MVVACYNEVMNARMIYTAIKDVWECMPNHNLEILFIDNGSTDGTRDILRELAQEDPETVKVILNARNYGTVRSHPYGYLQATGDCVVSLAADFQDPPELIPDFVELWDQGNEVVYADRLASFESPVMASVRNIFYKLARRISDVDLIENFNGLGLYDRRVIELFRQMDDPYPYFRGIIAEIGLNRASVPYNQPTRRAGVTKNNFFTLYDIAMNGITSHSKMPLRLVTLSGFLLGAISLMAAVIYLIYKILFWDSFQLGMAPLVIGQFLFNSIIIFILGLIGEYIGFINTRILKRPMVVESERLNFASVPPDQRIPSPVTPDRKT
ncbi:putative glycosyl transferase family protein [Magnetofaba australis IT-1]|uniref:Putative glycosyl transferase family protein n=1 Tax=Magnetofaba australis IT-1 TaxID=1434232 RepID=A0A1Y2K607_9PROT|nr:putative glycosyl transferase family protein [Magnetofaba australis IT-1]